MIKLVQLKGHNSQEHGASSNSIYGQSGGEVEQAKENWGSDLQVGRADMEEEGVREWQGGKEVAGQECRQPLPSGQQQRRRLNANAAAAAYMERTSPGLPPAAANFRHHKPHRSFDGAEDGRRLSGNRSNS